MTDREMQALTDQVVDLIEEEHDELTKPELDDLVYRVKNEALARWRLT